MTVFVINHLRMLLLMDSSTQNKVSAVKYCNFSAIVLLVKNRNTNLFPLAASLTLKIQESFIIKIILDPGTQIFCCPILAIFYSFILFFFLDVIYQEATG